MKETTLLLLGVVSLITPHILSQSQDFIPRDQPIRGEENTSTLHGLSSPEVVLQLNYARGELDRIYLTQFRKGRGVWTPSVPARTNLCSDLCHAGLGGEGCGPTCKDLIPVGLQSALHQAATKNVSTYFGEPRTSVCPTLCANKLGYPLCNCQEQKTEDYEHPNWGAICYSFCASDRYILGGCPTCDTPTTPSSMETIRIEPRLFSTASNGWAAWCNVQCRQGQGGAACNCDRTPFQ